MAAQTNNTRQLSQWEIMQQVAEARENARLRQQMVNQWALQGNNGALLGMLLGNAIKGGWDSQKRDWEESVAQNKATTAAHAEDSNVEVTPVKKNLYSSIRGAFDNLFGGGKKQEEKATPLYDAYVDAHYTNTTPIDRTSAEVYPRTSLGDAIGNGNNGNTNYDFNTPSIKDIIQKMRLGGYGYGGIQR